MAITRAKKEEIVTDLKDRLSRSRIAILTDYKGLSVAEVNKLRDELRKVDVEFRVAKNSLMKLAIKGSKMEGLGPHLQGPRAVAISYEDPVGPAKVLTEFAKGNEKLEIVAGVLVDKVISQEDIKDIAKLPSREELIAKLLGTMQAVPAGFVRVLAAIPQKLLYALTAIRDQKAE